MGDCIDMNTYTTNMLSNSENADRYRFIANDSLRDLYAAEKNLKDLRKIGL